jgi:hypothetical protein
MDSPQPPTTGYEPVRPKLPSSLPSGEYLQSRSKSVDITFETSVSDVQSPADHMDWEGPISNPSYVPMQESIIRMNKDQAVAANGDSNLEYGWVVVEQVSTMDTR